MSFFKNLFNSGEQSKAKPEWDSIGTTIEKFELPYLHPDHHDYPAWAGGDRYLNLLKTKWGNWIVYTNGLHNIVSGALYEIYIETDEAVEDFGSSWQANIIYAVGRLIPKVNDLSKRVERHQYLSIQIEMEGAPDDWSLKNETGNITLFVGLENPKIKLADFSFIPLNIKLMRPKEAEYVKANGDSARHELAKLYMRQGQTCVTSMIRESVI